MVQIVLKIEDDWFVDEYGRKILLRGVNLSGSAKIPATPNGATHLKTNFHDHREVSFVGRPLLINEAAEHFQRIKHWGFNTIRFVIPWEAIEHANPKKYDTEYLSYFQDLLTIAGEEFKLNLIIDPHQDAWSRLSGGDGAPGWTFEKVGLNYSKFNLSEAALVMQYRYSPEDPKAYEPMSWANNHLRLSNGTMWTLFFGGKDFVPNFAIDGINIQDYLQDHFINSFKELAKYVKDNPYVIGFSTLNEPSPGWIGQLVDGSTMDVSEILGYAFTPFDAMLTGSGYTRTIPFRAIKRLGIKEIRRDQLNPDKISCWIDEKRDVWKNEGIWEIDTDGNPVILKNDHFNMKNGQKINFLKDYLALFISKYANAIREIIPDTPIFCGLPLDLIVKGKKIDIELPPNIYLEGHWYDVASMGTKRFMKKANFDLRSGRPVIGEGNVQKMFIEQLAAIKETARKTFNKQLVLLGEIGMCFDLEKKKAFEIWKTNPTEAWQTHITAFSMYYRAIDANLLHSMHWNYTPDNDNTFGDQWNLEDFSIYSNDQRVDPVDLNSGGRAIEGFCRPYLEKIAGIPLKMSFDNQKKIFEVEFNAELSLNAPTIVYIPKIHYLAGYRVDTDGEWRKSEKDEQLILYKPKKAGYQKIIISPK